MHSIKGVLASQFLNLGLLYLVVSLNKPIYIIPNPYGFLTGEYDQLSAVWYADFGGLLVKTMIIEIVFPHLLPVS
jgi:hypothetical protein